ncbi:MAG: hypothetical protein QM754_02370 [Tepidisphaeraceae bacterium]
MSPAVKTTFAILTALSAAVGMLALMPNVLISKGFADKPPQGQQAMGLIVLFAFAAGAAALLLLATALALFTGGLNWAGGSGGVSAAVFIVLSVGMALGAVGAVIHWAEPRLLPVVPVCMVAGFVGPLLLVAVLVASAFAGPGLVTSPAGRIGLLAALTLCSLVGYTTAGMWGVLEFQRSSANAQASAQSQLELEAKWERLRNRTPMQAAEEDFAEFSDATPLWCIVTYLERSEEPAFQRFVIERCAESPELRAGLGRNAYE